MLGCFFVFLLYACCLRERLGNGLLPGLGKCGRSVCLRINARKLGIGELALDAGSSLAEGAGLPLRHHELPSKRFLADGVTFQHGLLLLNPRIQICKLLEQLGIVLVFSGLVPGMRLAGRMAVCIVNSATRASGVCWVRQWPRRTG